MGKVREFLEGVLCICIALYLEVFCTLRTVCNLFVCNTSWD